MINSFMAFGVINVSYEQYCPMADDNNGAYWLSESNKVLNPYFGSSMLNCGEIKNEIT